jgi:xanthine dehydrogenase accessory factor
LDIYLEPVKPKPQPQIMILGRSPVAQILARLGSTVGYGVATVSSNSPQDGIAGVESIVTTDFKLPDGRITSQTFLVVSTQGEGDEEALEQAITSNAHYVAFVASKTKAGKVLEFLKARGVSHEKISRVRAPAGLNIGATSPEEIAVSILAEIVQMRASAMKSADKPAPSLTLNVIPNEAAPQAGGRASRAVREGKRQGRKISPIKSML